LSSQYNPYSNFVKNVRQEVFYKIYPDKKTPKVVTAGHVCF